jgi:uncharacterized protein (UPF0264 family)
MRNVMVDGISPAASPVKTGFLASVTSVEEAILAKTHGAGIIDCKNPAAGALGALPVRTVSDIVRALNGQAPISATVGDVPLNPEAWVAAVDAMTSPGVDIIKIGLLPPGDYRACLEAIKPLAALYPLVAVVFADKPLPGVSMKDLVAAVAEAGFLGIMMDTALKDGARLTTAASGDSLREFVDAARAADLVSGLAGALTLDDIPLLRALHPDYLGFRSALCAEGVRDAALNPERLSAVAHALGAH